MLTVYRLHYIFFPGPARSPGRGELIRLDSVTGSQKPPEEKNKKKTTLITTNNEAFGRGWLVMCGCR